MDARKPNIPTCPMPLCLDLVLLSRDGHRSSPRRDPLRRFRVNSNAQLGRQCRAVSGKILRLTPARRNQAGAVWFRDKQPVRSGFETTFQFQLTQQDWLFHGTDGFAFVLQNSGPSALGGRGMAGGFGVSDPTNPPHPGIPWCIAVFFDTLRNPQEGDPSSNYIAIRAN
jgi:hypothetical protein